MFKTNYHIHPEFCDGKGSPEDLIKAAISRDFKIIGLSSHSMYPFASTWHIAPRDFSDYVTAVRNAAEKFKDKITVLCGFEADYIPFVTKPDFETYKSKSPDYLIGSVHYIFTENGRLAVDYSADKLKERIEQLFNGNSKKTNQEYFKLERKMLKEANFNIIGHPDLVRKNNEKLCMFNENDSWYREEIKITADEIKKAGVIAEINTGAIARGTMDDVYPSAEFLSLLRERNVPVTINTDCHSPEKIDCGYERALQAALKAGYSELAYIDRNNKIAFQKIC